MNRYLTAKNEKDVQKLLANSDARFLWQTASTLGTKSLADRNLAKKYNLPLTTVLAARYYW